MATDHDGVQESTDKKKNITTLRKQYCVMIGGLFLAFGPFLGMVTLQSSINIEENIGTLAMGVAYFVSVFMSLFIIPVAVRRIGSRSVLILGELSYLLYIAGNFYPKKWVMVTVAIIVGIGEALCWTALPVYLWHFGYSHGRFGRKKFTTYVRKYTGIFFACAKAGQVFASSLSYGILHGSKNRIISYSEDSYLATQNSLMRNDSISQIQSINDFQFCGAKDCLDPNVTKENIERYIPANSLSLYILLSAFCAVAAGGIIFHIWLLPAATTKHRTEETKQNTEDKHENEEEGLGEVVSHDGKINRSYWSTLSATFRHLFSLKQLLMAPQSLYSGLVSAFLAAEANRSFISCTLGVEQVGLVIVPFAVMSGSISLLAPKLIGKIGRTKIIFTILALDICNYTFCLLWQPTEDSKYLVYIIYVAFAFSDPMWKNCTLDIYTDYFPHDQEISRTVWNMLFTIGLTAGFLWSPLFCVSVKLYIQIGVAATSVIGYCIAEYIHGRRIRRTFSAWLVIVK